ncbi:MAG: hypothetical protein KDA24_02025 [Deltaproteobacteria bacterium]|nr:hypothetical protein [Deltaproteobacteria bacterium]
MASEDRDALASVVAGTWYAAVPSQPDAVAGLIDGPGGEGWLALFRGELSQAEAAFLASPDSTHPAVQLGLARVALARADVLVAARDLQERIVPEGVEYRALRADRIRVGAYEPLLAALSLQALAPNGEGTSASLKRARAWTPGEGVDPAPGTALLALLEARSSGTAPPAGLPSPLAERLAAGATLAAGEQPASSTLDTASPDYVDPLGEDAAAGLEFTISWWDPEVSRARLRAELLSVLTHAGAAGEAGQELVSIAHDAWGEAAPTLAPPTPAKGTVEPALTWFGGAWLDGADLRASWGLPGGSSLLARVAAAVPAERLTEGLTPADVDRVLRFEARLDQSLGQSLEGLASSPDGKSLVRDLELSRRFADQLLRRRMIEVSDAGAPVVALRLGERSLDVASSGAGDDMTRISHRNDAGFLVRLGGVHSAGRRPGVGREYLHPLVERFPGLAGAAYQLGQLDAASGIGVQGKTSQQ